ncbi:MAG: DNA polymerase III subunit beta, partial [Mucinivorans sp.]
MKFIISSTLLSQNLQSIGKVIATKNTLPILDYFLFELKGEQLSVTASDLETTLSTTIEVENVEQLDGSVAVPARRITDSIKEFSEQPLTISIDKESWEIVISWRSGKLSIPGITGMGYPEAAELGQGNEPTRVQLPSEVLGYGISSTIFATADDPLRPV